MKTLVIECPDKIHNGLDSLVQDGWANDVGQVVTEAIRRFLESHRPDVMESHVRNDVEWGLHGDD